MMTHEIPGQIFDPDEQRPPEDTSTTVNSAVYSMLKRSDRIRTHYTGDIETYLTAPQEQALLQKVFDAKIARKTLEQFNASLLESEEAHQLAKTIRDGEEASDLIVICNIRFAATMARNSMNIVHDLPSVNSGDEEEDEDETTPMKRKGAISARHIGDIRALRSPLASYDDRTQIAMLGLIEAVDKYSFDRRTKLGAPLRFSSSATYPIHNRLKKTIPVTEAGGGVAFGQPMTDDPMTVTGIYADMYRSLRTPEDYSDKQHRQLEFLRHIRMSTSFDEYDTGIFAPEEQEDDWTEAVSLPIADLIADPYETHDGRLVIEKDCQEKIIHTLETLSEREAGIISMYYGLGENEPRSFDQIGAVYGVSRERIRQVHSKALKRLRHPSRSEELKEYLDFSSNQQHFTPPTQTGEPIDGTRNLKTPYHFTDYRDETPLHHEEPQPQRPADLESWQAYPGEKWEDIHTESKEEDRTVDVPRETYRTFAKLLRYSDPRDFTKTGSLHYPTETLAAIYDTIGDTLTPSVVEHIWNSKLSAFTTSLERKIGDKDSVDLDAVSLLFTNLLANTLQDDDTVTLTIPNKLDGKLNYLGAQLEHGKIIFDGSVGDYIGYNMKGLGSIEVRGSVGDYAACNTSEMAQLEVSGDAGEQFAYGASGDGSFTVDGLIKSLSFAPEFKGEIRAGSITTINLAKKQLEPFTEIIAK